MLDKHAPAALTIQNEATDALYCVVLQQFEDTALVTNPGLKLGSILKFSSSAGEAITGVVTAISEEGATVTLSSSAAARRGRLDRLFRPSPQEFWFKDGLSSIGKLDVKCSVPSFHKGGLLGWSLVYKAPGTSRYVTLIRGHDYFSPGSCKVSGTGVWQAGEYKLTVGLFTETKQLIKTNSQLWRLPDASSSLSIGNLTDTKAPLIL